MNRFVYIRHNSVCYMFLTNRVRLVWFGLLKLIIKGLLLYSQRKLTRHPMSTKTLQAEMTTVSFATLDGVTRGTTSVPTGSPADEALKTHLQSAFGWRPYDIVLEMYDPCKYVILFDTASMRFIREECSVADATTEADKTTVQKELRAYIKRYTIPDLDLNEIYSHYNIITIYKNAFRDCTSLSTIAIPSSVTTICKNAFRDCTSLTTIAIPDSVTAICDTAFSGCTSLVSVESSKRMIENTMLRIIIRYKLGWLSVHS